MREIDKEQNGRKAAYKEMLSFDKDIKQNYRRIVDQMDSKPFQTVLSYYRQELQKIAQLKFAKSSADAGPVGFQIDQTKFKQFKQSNIISLISQPNSFILADCPALISSSQSNISATNTVCNNGVYCSSLADLHHGQCDQPKQS